MAVLGLFLCVALVSADVYMHVPRGSNDRNCERNVNRNNGNLLFDSQNNAKGGYACGRKVAGNGVLDQTPQMEYWEGSKLAIKWTAQHGTGALDTSKQGKAENTVDAEIVLQYACTNTLDPSKKYESANGLNQGTPRDGIPNNNNDAATDRANTNDQKGANGADSYQQDTMNRFTVHETAEFYQECNRVSRNKDLFTADQNVNRRSAIGTRQNPNGGRRGLECPEERDYYPYWRPTPWQDVALLATDGNRCGQKAAAAAYGIGEWCQPGSTDPDHLCTNDPSAPAGDSILESQSVSGKSYCALRYENVNGAMKMAAPNTATATATQNSAQALAAARRLYNRREWPMTQAKCEEVGQIWKTDAKFASREMMSTGNTVTPLAAGLATGAALEAQNAGPVCKVGEFSRPNHLGNGQAPAEFKAASLATGATPTANVEQGYAANTNTYVWTIPTFAAAVHSTYDKVGVNFAAALPCVLRLRYNMSTTDFARTLNAESNKQASPIQQDPYVEIGNDGTSATVRAGGTPTQLLALNMNTNQLARTFQDRSYVFKVRAPDVTQTAELAAGCPLGVWNMNVRGKRGNIVQTYPSVEYDWAPSSVCVPAGACMHFQASGSDYNPRRGCNDGAGGPPDPDNGGQSNQNARADRSNLVEQVDFANSYPLVTEGTANTAAKLAYNEAGNDLKGTGNKKSFFASRQQAYRFAFLDQELQLRGEADAAREDNMWEGATYFYDRNSARQGCMTQDQIENLNNGNRRETHPRNCAFLNAARTPYQNQGIVKIDAAIHQEGDKYALYSSRNNNFSNREQQLAIQIGRAVGDGVTCAAESVTPVTPVTPVTTPGIISLVPDLNEAELTANIVRMAELDIPGDDPVENDGTGDGIKVGCTSLIMNSSPAEGVSFVSALLVFSMVFFR